MCKEKYLIVKNCHPGIFLSKQLFIDEKIKFQSQEISKSISKVKHLIFFHSRAWHQILVYHLFLQIPFWSVYQPQDLCYPRIPSSSLQTDSKEIIHQDKKYFPQFDIFNDYQMFEITTSSTIYIKLKIYKIGLSKLVFCEFLTNFCKYVEETVLI